MPHPGGMNAISRRRGGLLRDAGRAAMILLGLLAAACDEPAAFVSPLPVDGAAAVDERLFGGWAVVSAEGDEAAHASLSIQRREGGGAIATGMLAGFKYTRIYGGESEISLMVWEAAPTSLDGVAYFSARALNAARLELRDPNWSEPTSAQFIRSMTMGYWIGRAWIDPADQLNISFIMRDELKRLEGWKIPKRTVDCGEDCSADLFDLTEEEVAKLVRESDRFDLFKSRYVLSRVGSGPAYEENR